MLGGVCEQGCKKTQGCLVFLVGGCKWKAKSASSCNWESFLCVCRQKADGAVVEVLNDGKIKTSRQALLVRRLLCQQATHAHQGNKGTIRAHLVAHTHLHTSLPFG